MGLMHHPKEGIDLSDKIGWERERFAERKMADSQHKHHARVAKGGGLHIDGHRHHPWRPANGADITIGFRSYQQARRANSDDSCRPKRPVGWGNTTIDKDFYFAGAVWRDGCNDDA